MKIVKKRYRNTAFLMELMINILVFSMSCAVLVGLFGKAGQISKRSEEKAHANNEVLAMIETIKARGAGTQELAYSEWENDTTLVRWYDAKWDPTAKAEAVYQVRLTMQTQPTRAGVLTHMQASAADLEGREICSVETTAYQPSQDKGGELL